MTDFDSIKAATLALAERPFVMPIEEIQLAVAFAELEDPERTVERLISELFPHDDFHVRRVAINACRRAKASGARGLMEALTGRLADPAAWVRHDAAWAIEDAGFDSPELRRMLALAATAGLPEDSPERQARPGDAEGQARLRARQALDILRARVG